MSIKSKILFISTNHIWSGSEELWYHSALQFIQKNYSVSFALHYEYHKIDNVKDKLAFCYKLNNSFNLLQRVLNKIKGFQPSECHQLKEKVKYLNPELIVISQGGTIESLQMMELFIELQIPFVIVTQLVTKVHLLRLNGNNHQRFIEAYEKAMKIYFVSTNNLDLNQSMLGYTSSNSEVVFNPYRFNNSAEIYPSTQNGFKIAFVGRIEFYHKGIDLLLEVIASRKWQEREVSFNFYGTGPHDLLLQKSIEKLSIKNVVAHGLTDDIAKVWEYNHACILTSRMEGQALSLIEALMCKRIGIVTNVGGASEIIDDNISGFVAKDTSLWAIDEALERAWERRFEWQKMGENAKVILTSKIPNDAVSFFSEKLEGVLKSLIKS